MKTQLSSGQLSVGDRLPGERALAETLQVSRASLREALKVLEALGTIRSAPGSGPASGTIIVAEPEQALSLALNLQFTTTGVNFEEIAAVRILLETWAAAHSKQALGDWEACERLLQHMDSPELSIEDFLALDAQFHVAMSRSAGNPLLSTLMEALRMSIAEHTIERARAATDWSRTVARLREEHWGILDALRTGDTATGAQLLRAHIEAYVRDTES